MRDVTPPEICESCCDNRALDRHDRCSRCLARDAVATVDSGVDRALAIDRID